jgi:uncharacterized membrane protein YgaE (UPF0421/DUF939 family)
MEDLNTAIKEVESFLQSAQHEDLTLLLQRLLKQLHQIRESVTMRTKTKEVARESRSNSDQVSSIASNPALQEIAALNASTDFANELDESSFFTPRESLHETDTIPRGESSEKAVSSQKETDETVSAQKNENPVESAMQKESDELETDDISALLNSTNRDIISGKRHTDTNFLTHAVVIDRLNLRFSILVFICLWPDLIRSSVNILGIMSTLLWDSCK